MTTYLILARTGPTANPDGDMVLYVAAAVSEAAATEATRAELPARWRVDKVIGTASDLLTTALKLAPGTVLRLS